jgi:hypothetical protein
MTSTIIAMTADDGGLSWETISCASREAAEKLIADHHHHFTRPRDGGYRETIIIDADHQGDYDEASFREEYGDADVDVASDLLDAVAKYRRYPGSWDNRGADAAEKAAHRLMA